MLLAARFLPFITSRCEAVLVAPIRGIEHFPRERVERLSRSMSMWWSASGYSKLLNPRLESRSLAKQCSRDIPARFFIGSREHAIQRGTVEAKEQIIKGG